MTSFVIFGIIVKKGNTSSVIFRGYTTWLDACFSKVVIYCMSMRKIVGIGKSSLRIICA